MNYALELAQLTKTYAGGVKALRGIDLSVEAGDFYALLGPNGAGKSTTIGIISSLVNKTAGSVRVFGYDIDKDIVNAKRQLGLVPQEFNFNPFETVLQIVVNQAGYYGVTRREAMARAEKYLNQLDLWGKRNERARMLSGGMKRRLMIARALMHQPKLLILDEPTAGVDIELRRSMWGFLKELNAQGTTIILTTHYLEEATVKEIKIATGDKVKTGSLIMVFEVEGAAPAAAAAPAAKADAAPAPAAAKAAAPAAKADDKGEFAENAAYVHATPVIRRLAREFGVNLAKVKGTGRKGRILREDVQTYVKDAVKRAEAAPAAAGGGLPGMLPWPKVDFSKFGEIEEVEMGRIQKISGANLSRNWVMIPHVTHFDKTDITDLEAFRKQQNEEAAKRKLDVKFTPVVFIMKAVAAALEQMPRFNSSLSEDGQKLTLKKYINIGVAVDTPNGLVVPVFKDVNKKSITELSRELMAISKKARDGKLTAGEMQGGCFTISSLGGIGTTHFAPIVNAPEVAILGVSKSAMEPVWNGKEFMPRLMMPMSLSFDHRVIDGADGARFITIINNMLSDIRRLVM